MAEIAVVGRVHPRWLEVPIAYVVLAAGHRTSEAQLREHCAPRLATFTVPAAFRIVDTLPRTPSGKVLERQRRERAMSAEPAQA